MKDTIDQQIQTLVQSGLATHLIRNPRSVDSVFAVAKAQDLPQVTFAAAFEDGSLVIGCPTDLPDVLAELAEPLEPQVPTEPQPEEPDLSAQIAALSAQVANLAQPAATPEITELAALMRAEVTDALAQSQLTNRLDDVGKALAGSDMATQLTRIEKLLNVLHAHINPDLTAVRAQLEEISGAMTEPQTPVINALERIETQLSTLEKAVSHDEPLLEDIGDKLATLLALDTATTEIHTQVAALADLVHDQGEETRSRILPVLESGLTQLKSTINEMGDAAETRSAPDIADTSAPQLETALDHLATRFEHLADRLGNAVDVDQPVFRSGAGRRAVDAPAQTDLKQADIQTLLSEVLRTHLRQQNGAALTVNGSEHR